MRASVRMATSATPWCVVANVAHIHDLTKDKETRLWASRPRTAATSTYTHETAIVDVFELELVQRAES
jgi:hypothetical protein